MDLSRGVYAADRKNRPGVMALTVSGREVRGYVGVSQRQKGKNSNHLAPTLAPKEANLLVRCCQLWLVLVGLAGFEPTTSCPPDKRATKLRYSPNDL